MRRFNSEDQAKAWIAGLKAPRASGIRADNGYLVETVPSKGDKFVYSKKDVESFEWDKEPAKVVRHILYVHWPLRRASIDEDTDDVQQRLEGIAHKRLSVGTGMGLRDVEYLIDRHRIREAIAALSDLKLVTARDGGPRRVK